MHLFHAVETEMMLTMLTSPSVLVPFDYSRAATSRNRAPAHVVHGCDSILYAKTLVLIHHLLIQIQVLDVQVVEALEAIGIWTAQLTNLSFIYLCANHVYETLSTIEVLTTRQE